MLIGFLKLVRIASSITTASTVFIPLYLSGIDAWYCAKFALPILTTSMGGFILNDVLDAERDKLNHPKRPIPEGRVSKKQAIGLYFLMLLLTLVLVKLWIPTKELFYYLLFIISFANYGFVVDRFPVLKNPYVGAATVVPVLIVISISKSDAPTTWLIAPAFLFMTGRELLMDIQDQMGDGRTLVKILGEERGADIAFTSQLLAVCLLIPVATTTAEWLATAALLAMSILLFLLWKYRLLRGLAPQIMRVQMALGLVFLVTSPTHQQSSILW